MIYLVLLVVSEQMLANTLLKLKSVSPFPHFWTTSKCLKVFTSLLTGTEHSLFFFANLMRSTPASHKIKYIPYLPYFYKLLSSQQKVLAVYIEILFCSVLCIVLYVNCAIFMILLIVIKAISFYTEFRNRSR